MIKEVRLQNFKGYRNPSPIKFSCDKEKNVTLIYGVMGAGKTSFFEAINWALYGKKVEGKKNTILDLSNIAGKYLLDELEESEQAEVKVEIDFEHTGYDYYLSRGAFFQKRKNKLNYLRENDHVKLHTVSDTSQSRTYDSRKGDEETIFKMISNILPFSSREYFLFDGEKLDKFSSIDSSSEIKNAIRQVLGLTDLENARQNLKKIEKELSKEFNLLEGKNDEVRLTTMSINRIDDEIKKLDDKIVEDEDLLIKVRAEFKINEEKIDSFKEEIGKIEERKRLEKNIDDTKVKLKTQRKKLRSLLTSAYSSYSINTIIKGIDLLDKWQKEGKFPAEYYNLDFIEKILRERKCFFWSFEKDSEQERYFLSEKNRLISWNRSTQEHLTQLFGDLKGYKEKSANLYSDIKKEHDIFVSLQGDLEEDTYDLQQINRDIKSNITDDEMRKCEETRSRLTKEKNDLETKIGINKAKIEEKNADLKKLNKHLLTLTAKTDKGKIIKKKLELITNSIDYLEKLHEHYSQIKRKEVEELTKYLFESIFWKKTHFDQVKLSEDYKLVVSDRWDSEGRETFSAGEREVLSLSFVSALAKSASKYAPFVVDTPFARISNEPTDNIAVCLPQHLTQLILFVTDKELTHKAEELFLNRCEYVWTIMFDQETSNVELLEGKHVRSN
jgi:DNA sulfur modification protein DndD